MKLRQILRAAGSKSDSTGECRGRRTPAGFLGYTEILMSFRCLAMGAFWTYDNLNYLTTTDTVNFGVARAQRGFSRSWSVSSALFILLGIDALRKVCWFVGPCWVGFFLVAYISTKCVLLLPPALYRVSRSIRPGVMGRAESVHVTATVYPPWLLLLAAALTRCCSCSPLLNSLLQPAV